MSADFRVLLKRYEFDLSVIFDQWPKLHLGLDVRPEIPNLKGLYSLPWAWGSSTYFTWLLIDVFFFSDNLKMLQRYKNNLSESSSLFSLFVFSLLCFYQSKNSVDLQYGINCIKNNRTWCLFQQGHALFNIFFHLSAKLLSNYPGNFIAILSKSCKFWLIANFLATRISSGRDV